MVNVKLPDGSVRPFDKPVSVAEVAKSIGPGLAKAALAGKVDGKLVDTSYRVDADADLAIVTDKDAEGLEILRHSTAHLLAHAVKELFPDAQVTIGPVIEDGFYYDFAFQRPFTPEDLAAIEKRMQEIAKRDLKVERQVMPRDEAVKFFRDLGERYKAEIIASIPEGEKISLYRQDGFVDLCRGPHVPSTGKLKVFKLMKVAGAYWRGDSKNEMLQRIYGTAWARKEDQDAYLHRLEEAEKRDHRKLGRSLDLFHTQDEAPGMVFWHPKGWTIWQQVEQYMRGIQRDNGYLEVKAPSVLDVSLWKRSGHWDNFRENMFFTESESREYAVKPMNCPGHVQIFNQGLKSYRDLPLRLAEFGACHRNEPSGALHGIMRVRAFTQDDAHIFCTEEQVQPEVVRFIDLLQRVYADFGFDEILVKLSTRPAKRVGTDEQWDKAEAALKTCARPQGLALRPATRRGRVLRTEDRVLAQGQPRAGVAMRHDAARFLHAGKAGRGIRCGRQLAPHSGHAAPGDPRLVRALHRHTDRALCGGDAGVARAGTGRRDEHHRASVGLRRAGRGGAQAGRITRRGRLAK